jgi:hypothetical protein
MIRARSKRDRERLDYESGRAIRILNLLAYMLRMTGDQDMAQAVKLIARDLSRARDGERTGFDTMGGRAEWLKERDAA